MFPCWNRRRRRALKCNILLYLCVGSYWETLKILCNGSFIDQSDETAEVRPFYPGKFQNLLPYKSVPADPEFYIARAQQLSMLEESVRSSAARSRSPLQEGRTREYTNFRHTKSSRDDGSFAAESAFAVGHPAQTKAEHTYGFYQELLSGAVSPSARERERAKRFSPKSTSSITFKEDRNVFSYMYTAQSDSDEFGPREHLAGIQLPEDALLLLRKMSEASEDTSKSHTRRPVPSSAKKSTTATAKESSPQLEKPSTMQRMDMREDSLDTVAPAPGIAEELRAFGNSEKAYEAHQVEASRGIESSTENLDTFHFFVSMKSPGEPSRTDTSFTVTRGGNKPNKPERRSRKGEGVVDEDKGEQLQDSNTTGNPVLQGQESPSGGAGLQRDTETLKNVSKAATGTRICSHSEEDKTVEFAALDGCSYSGRDAQNPEKNAVVSPARQSEESLIIDSTAYNLMQAQDFLDTHAPRGTDEERIALTRLALERLAEAAAHKAAIFSRTEAANAVAAAARAAVRGITPLAPAGSTPASRIDPAREAAAELEAGTLLFRTVQALPLDIIQALIKTPGDPYALVRCAKGFVGISSSLCASSLDQELPISGSCLGAATFDTELARCFTVSEVEPMAACPMGYRIARPPLDYQYGPCRPIERMPAIPSCDPPFIFDPAVLRCLYNATHAGYIGCPPGSLALNETACATAIQVLKNVTCPTNYEALLTKEGEGECRKTLKGRGDYSTYPRCPGNAQEAINYDLYDEYNKPVVTCVSTEILRGSATCPTSTVPYYDYMKQKRKPPVVVDVTLGAPVRTCVKLREGQIRPSCYDMEKQVPFVLLIGKKEEEKEPINYNMLLPNLLIENLIKPDWTTFKKDTQDGNEGNPLYRRAEDIAVRVMCLSFHYAQPVLRCPEGFIRGGPNLQECRRKAFVDFILTCPPGYYLNEVSLIYGMYYNPRPTCIGKLPAATQYFCPLVKSTRLATKRPERVMYLKDIERKRCVKARVTRPLWTPSEETFDTVFPGVLKMETKGFNPYPGIAKLSEGYSEQLQ